MNPVRKRSGKKLMKVAWTYPVYVSPSDKREVKAGGSRARAARKALPWNEALATVAADDRRPMIVLRECDSCKGTDDALLSKRFDNERTMLMTQWFRMIKLPTDVVEENHPFNLLFKDTGMPHLFLATSDGSTVVNLDGAQSQTALWKAMGKVLAAAYEDNPDRALKKMYKVLDRLDVLDIEEDNLVRRLEKEYETRGPNSGKAKKLRKKIEKVNAERERTLAEHAAQTKLRLRAAG